MLLDLALNIIFYPVGKAAIWLFSAGRVSAETILSAPRRISDTPWHGLKRDKKNRLIVSEGWTFFVGFLVCLACLMLLLAVTTAP